jgi:hypothetical protein
MSGNAHAKHNVHAMLLSYDASTCITRAAARYDVGIRLYATGEPRDNPALYFQLMLLLDV